MEKEIKLAARILKGQYLLFWLIPVLIFIAGETELADVGCIADNPRQRFIWETVGVILTLIFVPLPLRLFNWVLKKKIDTMTFPEALKSYLRWSAIRLGLLEIAVVANLIVYYASLNSIGGLCALIGLTASVFCLPSMGRLREELRVDGDKEKKES